MKCESPMRRTIGDIQDKAGKVQKTDLVQRSLWPKKYPFFEKQLKHWPESQCKLMPFIGTYLK